MTPCRLLHMMPLLLTPIILALLGSTAQGLEVEVHPPTNAEPGQTITVAVSVTNAVDVVSFGFSLDYDTTRFDYVDGSATVTSNVPPQGPPFEPVFVEGPPFQAFLVGDGSLYTLGDLVEIDFLVKPSAPLGPTLFDLNGADVGTDGGATEVTLVDGDPDLIDSEFYVGSLILTVPGLGWPGAVILTLVIAVGAANQLRNRRRAA